jgi:hypothetical protein
MRISIHREIDVAVAGELLSLLGMNASPSHPRRERVAARGALAALVDRHGALRSTFSADGLATWSRIRELSGKPPVANKR